MQHHAALADAERITALTAQLERLDARRLSAVAEFVADLMQDGDETLPRAITPLDLAALGHGRDGGGREAGGRAGRAHESFDTRLGLVLGGLPGGRESELGNSLWCAMNVVLVVGEVIVKELAATGGVWRDTSDLESGLLQFLVGQNDLAAAIRKALGWPGASPRG